MFLKIHRSPGTGEVVAVCDQELLNTTLREGEIEMCVSEGFYGTNPATNSEVKDALQNASNINLVGKRAFSIAVDLMLINEDGCMMIGDVPHAQIFRL